MSQSPELQVRTAGGGMRRSYLRVAVSWVAVLAALYALQQYFAVR